MKYVDEYRDRQLSGRIVDRIKAVACKDIRLMEVCGTHTVSIFRNGLRSVLPSSITLLSGPGCPVCVADQNDIDAFIALAGMKNSIIATFGDLMRVPGSRSSLQQEKAEGRDICMVYSTVDAIELAKAHPGRNIIFLGIGFETTTPTIAASLISARQMGLSNFFVYSAHKRVPPALFALMETVGVKIDGFLLPGHVSVIIGSDAYLPFTERFQIPCAIAGFEPADILLAILQLSEQIASGRPQLENCYPRAVSAGGNSRARELTDTVFEVCDARWRGMGIIPGSGLKIRGEFEQFDAQKQFKVDVPESVSPGGCICGDILTGKKTPPECLLFKKVCTPLSPVGPCMVSTEGTCAAYYKYFRPVGAKDENE